MTGWATEHSFNLVSGPAQSHDVCAPTFDADGRLIEGSLPAPRLRQWSAALGKYFDVHDYEICDASFESIVGNLVEQIDRRCTSKPPPEYGGD